GNEGFWNWLAQYGYGFLDFLHIIDSRQRGRRFRDLGLINQPGMKGSDVPGPWGLYLDTVDEELQPPPGAAAYSDQDDSRYATASYNSRPDPQGRSLTSDGV